MSGFTLGKTTNGNIKVSVTIVSIQLLDLWIFWKLLSCDAQTKEFLPIPHIARWTLHRTYFFSVLSRRWQKLRLFCKEALVAIKSYQELRASLDSLQDVLEVCSDTVDNSTNDESTLQVRLVFFSTAYVLASQVAVAASFFEL